MKYALKSFYDYYHEDNSVKWNKRRHIILRPLKKQYNKHVPSHKEVYQMVDATPNIRDKTIISLMYNTGLGHQAIRNLDYKDVVYQLENDDYPLEIIVDGRIYPRRFRYNTGATSYTVFFDKDCADLLRLYLRESRPLREEVGKRKGISIDDTPLFMTDANWIKGTRLSIWAIGELIKRAIKRTL